MKIVNEIKQGNKSKELIPDSITYNDQLVEGDENLANSSSILRMFRVICIVVFPD